MPPIHPITTALTPASHTHSTHPPPLHTLWPPQTHSDPPPPPTTTTTTHHHHHPPPTTHLPLIQQSTHPSQGLTYQISLATYSKFYLSQYILEQLERFRSEDTPAASWLPIPLSHIGSQVKIRQSQSYKFKKFAKISNFKIRWVFLQIQSGHGSVHRRTDGQGDTSIPPFQLCWSGGYNYIDRWLSARLQ